MKSNKKQIKSNASKNHLDEKTMSPGIATFFKPVPKKFVIEENITETKTDDGDKMHFVATLKEKLRLIRGETNEDASKVALVEVASEEEGHCNGILPPIESPIECCTTLKSNCIECAQKDLGISEWKRKYNELIKVHAKQSIHFTELYSKYNDLLKTVEIINKPTAEEAASSTDIFTLSEVKFLQCMDLAKTKDCTFVHHCLQFAYKTDLTVLASKTLRGTASWTGTKNGEQVHHDAKDPLTPAKVHRIKALFADRISKCRLDSVEYAERMKDPYINKLIAAGVKNISQKKV